MKIIRKYAEFIGYTICHGERMNDWRCPNKNCGMGVAEEYTCCPYCGQKIKFKEPPKVKMIEISIKVGGVNEQSITNIIQHRNGSGDTGREKDGYKASSEVA